MLPYPLGDKLCVQLLPQAERSQVIATITRETPLRRATIVRLGPDANVRHEGKLAEGKTVLVNILPAQAFGDDLVLPSSAVIATFKEDV